MPDLAAAAASSSILAVIASRRNLAPSEAATFTEGFYKAIAEGASIASALQSARRNLATSSNAFAAASFTLTCFGEGDALSEVLLPASSVTDHRDSVAPPEVPLHVLRLWERGRGEILAIQAHDEQARSAIESISYWGPKLLSPVSVTLTVPRNIDQALSALAYPADDAVRVHDWTRLLDTADFLRYRDSPVPCSHPRSGLDVVLLKVSPRWLRNAMSGVSVNEVPAAPVLCSGRRQDRPRSSALELTALSQQPVGSWLLKFDINDAPAIDLLQEIPLSGESRRGEAVLLGPLKLIADELKSNDVLSVLSVFATGILVPRTEPIAPAPDERIWQTATELAQRSLQAGLAHVLDGPRAQLFVFDLPLASAIIDSLWIAAPDLDLPLELWAESELDVCRTWLSIRESRPCARLRCASGQTPGSCVSQR